MNDTAVTPLPLPASIQGEQQAQRRTPQAMEQGAVDEYVAKMDDAVVACRERGRHLFPPVRTGRHPFVGYLQDEGLYVQEEDCECCGPLAYQRTLWEARGKGTAVRFVPIVSNTLYRKIVRDGQVVSYLAPAGQGRMYRRQVREAVATQALRGTPLRQVRKQAIEAQAGKK